MKKVAIVPLTYKSYNYGGTLQYYALQTAINSLGFESKVLDIDDYGNKIFRNTKNNKKNIKLFDKIIHKIIWEYCEFMSKKNITSFECRNRKFDEFREKFIDSFHPESLDDLADSFNAFVVGSDQIWNPQWAKSTHFLDFAKNQLKIVYGASIGKKSLSEEQKIRYGELLLGFDAISGREKDVAQQLQPFCSNKIETVMDPVFLLNQQEWINLIEKDRGKDKEYIFCYLIGDDIKYRKELNKIKKDMKKNLISIPYISQKYICFENYADEMRYNAGPLEFLKLILDSEYIITDSFHATAFSILFHKRFSVLNREPQNSQMLSRIITLLDYFDLGDHLVDSVNDISIEQPNWKEIDLKIEKLTNKSMLFLKNSLK